MNGELIDAVIWVESKGKPLARSLRGARGLMQVRKPALDDYNNYHKTSYSLDDLYDPDLNKKIGGWYLLKRIPAMLKAYKLPVTLDNVLWAYNAGIGRVVKGIMPKETKDFLERVKRRLQR